MGKFWLLVGLLALAGCGGSGTSAPDGSTNTSPRATTASSVPVANVPSGASFAAPSQVTLSPTALGVMKLSWSAPSGLDPVAGYRIRFASDAAFSQPVPYFNLLTVGNVLNLPITGLSPATHYYAQVAAIDTQGRVSAYSVTATATSFAAPSGNTYYIVPNNTNGKGSGSLANPFGIDQLLNTSTTPVSQGPALTVLRPGDTLMFRAGDYHISGPNVATYYSCQLISPVVSGTPSGPITLEAYPGDTVRIFVDAGSQPAFGTETPSLNYVRFLGFTVASLSAVSRAPVDPNPSVARGFDITGIGNEIGYDEVIGSYQPTFDNHEGILLDPGATDTWVHNNEVAGVQGDSINSACIKIYAAVSSIVERNYLHGCTVGVFDKETLAPNLPTYRLNWVTQNSHTQFVGNNQGNLATFFIYDNVFSGTTPLNFNTLTKNSLIHNNMFVVQNGTELGANYVAVDDNNNTGQVYNTRLWDNLVLSADGVPLWAYATYNAFSKSGSTAPIGYMDHNVYDVPVEYFFSGSTIFTLPQFQAQGFETHSVVVASDADIFQGSASYVLLPQWLTAGRFGGTVGPRLSISSIMDPSQYGPAAMTGGNP